MGKESNIPHCQSNCSALDEASQSERAALEVMAQFREENLALRKMLEEAQRSLSKMDAAVIEAEEKGYDLGIQSVLHNFLGFPWKDAGEASQKIIDAVKAKAAGKLLSLPCAPKASVYIVDMAPLRCDLCKHGFDPSEALDKRTALRKYSKCEKCCPLYIRSIPADGFVVESDESGWIAARPFTHTDLCAKVGDLNPIEGCFDDNYFFSKDTAKEYLSSCAQENNATILENPNNSIF